MSEADILHATAELAARLESLIATLASKRLITRKDFQRHMPRGEAKVRQLLKRYYPDIWAFLEKPATDRKT